MAKDFGIRISDVFNTMEARFLAGEARGITSSIGYKITGDGGGSWKLSIDDGKMEIGETAGDPEGCDVIISTDAGTFAGINLGRLNPADEMASGKLEITGNVTLLSTVLSKVFRPFATAVKPAEPGRELIRLQCVTNIGQRFATGPVMGRWFKGLKEKKFLANVCPVCGRTQVPPREACADCRVRCTEFVEVGPGATVTGIDKVFYASPDPLTGKVRETPYAAFFMVLDGSTPGESFCHEIKKEDFQRLKTGSRVRPVWSDVRTGSFRDLLCFEIAD